jgi:hypothetical protein
MQLTTIPAAQATLADPIRWNASAGRGGNRVPAEHGVEVAPFERSLGFGMGRYAFQGGVAQALAGIEVLVERGGPVAPEQVLARIGAQLAALPSALTDRLRQIIVYRGQDTGYDGYWERAYGIPGFQAVAAGGGGQVTFFGGQPYNDGTLFHELGHNLPVSTGEWRRAVAADDRTIAQLAKGATLAPVEFEPVPDPVRRERWTARLAPGGITPYADGRWGEDISEALRMLFSERRFGHAFATSTDAAGGVRELRFGDAYPARTALLERASRTDLDGDGVIGG